jgi:hypothetical protein
VEGSSLTPDEIRAAAETHRELGPDYQAAVIDSFLDKVGKEIDGRVDQRMTAYAAYARPPLAKPPRGRSPMALAVVSLSLGIPLSGIALGVPRSDVARLVALIVIWAAITAINLSYSFGGKSPVPPRR